MVQNTAQVLPALSVGGGDDHPVRLERSAGAPALQRPGVGWPYLDSAVFKARGALAAHFLNDAPAVLEIGGGITSIDNFVTGKSVVVLDPFIPDDDRELPGGGRVRHVRGRFQDIAWTIERPGGYGLVLLGLELLFMRDEHWAELIKLIEGASKTVIEFSSTFDTPAWQFALIRQRSRTREVAKLKLDLSGNDFNMPAESWPVHAKREIHVLEAG